MRYSYANVNGRVPSSGASGRQYPTMLSFATKPDLDAVFGTDTDTDERNEYFFLNKGSLIVEISSAANMPQTVDVYHFVCKRDSDTDPLTLWQTGCNDKGLGAAGSGVNFPFQTPFFSDSFNEFFRVTKKKTYKVGGGGSFTTLIKMNYKKLLTRQQWNESTYIRGLSFGLIFVVRGTLGYSTVDSRAAYMTPELLYFGERCFTYKVVPGANKSSVKINPSIFTGTTMSLINVENDAPDVPVKL